jgi:peroxiredoxin Q/BCP
MERLRLFCLTQEMDMKRFATPLALLGLLAFGVSMADAAELKVGDDAPEFTMMGSDGKEHKLSDYKGKQAVVIAWFPKAFTGGCTAECKSMRENGQAIKAYDVAYFTASTDTAEENTKFAKSLDLDYPILSDPTKATSKAYGVLNEMRGMAQRWTFYISKDGKIAAIDKEVKTMSHGKDIAGKLQDLGVTKR